MNSTPLRLLKLASFCNIKVEKLKKNFYYKLDSDQHNLKYRLLTGKQDFDNLSENF